MKLLIEMTLQSDAVFGNGLSIPGGEDIATQMDDAGFPYTRDFTSLENGMAKEGSLRQCRCVKSGFHFYGTCVCDAQDAELVKEVLGLIKWVGTMRNRGFGEVSICVEDQHE